MKRCMICNKEAKFRIKDSSEFYCESCANENFCDLKLLQRVEEQAKKIKELIKNNPSKINNKATYTR